MIDTIIVSGGNIHKGFALDFLKKAVKEKKRENICLIAADKGMEFFMDTPFEPDVIVGDFDSICAEGKHYMEQALNAEIHRLKPEKDDSDTQSAVNLAIERGAKEIAILGATGTRLDHVMANLGLLVMAKEKGVRIILADQNNHISLAESNTVLKREEQFGKYVSFFPIGGDVEGLTLTGFQYSLKEYHLTTADCGLTVSNEIREEEACISYKKGTLLMIMSRD